MGTKLDALGDAGASRGGNGGALTLWKGWWTSQWRQWLDSIVRNHHMREEDREMESINKNVKCCLSLSVGGV